jgi:hypothetical protein
MTPYPRASWHLYYLVLAGGSIVFVGLVAVDVGPFSNVSPLVAAATIVSAMLVTSVTHHLCERRER